MPHTIHHINIDCLNPTALAEFWQVLTGMELEPTEPAETAGPAGNPAEPAGNPAGNVDADPDEVLLFDPAQRSPNLLFTRVPEPRVGKNRVHLDIQPTHTTRDRSVEEAVALGATVLDDRRKPSGGGWVVMADPEGNEFCIERSLAERGPDPWLSAHGSAHGSDLGRRPMDLDRTNPNDMLLSMLDWYREGVERKVSAMPDHAVRLRLGRSDTSVIGVLNHLALVEDSWFTERVGGGTAPEAFASVDWEADPDFEFRTARDESLDVVLARYVAACARSRAVVAACGLDDRITAGTTTPEFSVRWAVVHMIEETARHLGHIDILAELTAGLTGE